MWFREATRLPKEKQNERERKKCSENTIFTLQSVATLTLIAYNITPKIRTSPFYYLLKPLKLLDEWQTVQSQIRRRVLRRLIRLYTVGSGLSVSILRVSTSCFPLKCIFISSMVQNKCNAMREKKKKKKKRTLKHLREAQSRMNLRIRTDLLVFFV